MNTKTLFALFVLVGLVLPASSQVVLQGNSGGGVQVGSATGGGGGYVSPLAGKTLVDMGDSRQIVAGSCQVGALSEDAISGCTISSHIATCTEANTNNQVVNNALLLSTFGGSYTALNGFVATVTGMPGTNQFTFDATSTGVPDGSTGAGYESCKYALPQQQRDDPLYAGVTIVQKSAGGDSAANEAATFSTNPNFPSVTPGSTILVSQLGSQDCLSGYAQATTEANLFSYMQQVHAKGYLYTAETLLQVPSNVYASVAANCTQTISTWLSQQSKTSLNSNPAVCTTAGVAGQPGQTAGSNICGYYWNSFADPAALLPFYPNRYFFCDYPDNPATNCENLHLTDPGVSRLEAAISTATISNTIQPGLGDIQQVVSSDQAAMLNMRVSTVNNSTGSTGPVASFGITLPNYNFSKEYDQGGHSALQFYAPNADQLVTDMPGDSLQCFDTQLLINPYLNDNTDVCRMHDPANVQTEILVSGSTAATALMPDANLSAHNVSINGALNLITNPVDLALNNQSQTFNGTQTVVAPDANNAAAIFSANTTGILQPVFVQGSSDGTGTLPNPVTAGNAIVVNCGNAEGALPGVTDNLGNTYTTAASVNHYGDHNVWSAVACNINSGTITVSETAHPGCGINGMSVAEYTNVAASSSCVDGSGVAMLTTYNPLGVGIQWTSTTPTLTTTQPNDRLIAAYGRIDTGIPTYLGKFATPDTSSTSTSMSSTPAYAAGVQKGVSVSYPYNGYGGLMLFALKGKSVSGAAAPAVRSQGDITLSDSAINGVIWKDTVDGSCRRFQLSGGILVGTEIPCP